MSDVPLSSHSPGEDPKLLEDALLEGVHTTQTIDLNPLTFPAARVTAGYRVAFTLASAVGGLSSVCIKQLLLPIQVSALDPVSTNTSFALVASIGAFAGLLASPLSGALSDSRSHSCVYVTVLEHGELASVKMQTQIAECG